MKVLIIEDEEMLNNIIAKRLKVESMIVDQCYNGEQNTGPFLNCQRCPRR